MADTIPQSMEGHNSYGQGLNGMRPWSILSSRRYSVSPEQSIEYGEHGEQITETSFVTYHEIPPQSYPLLPLPENHVTGTSKGVQSLNAQEISGDVDRAEQQQTKVSKSTHTWRLEIGAVVLSLCAMTALIVLLAHADKQPLNNWRFLISFNTIISILGAAARAPLGFVMGSCLGQAKWNWFKKRPDKLSAFQKFEEASRGPMGSFWLLSWLHVRHWSALGALVTVVLLGFEPFLQAVVIYTGQLDTSQGLSSPTIGISINLDAGSYSNPYNGYGPPSVFPLPTGELISVLDYSSTPDVGMTASLINSLNNASQQTESTIPFFCPSGNCTWAPYTTLAACSICKDVTASLIRNTTFGRNLGTLNTVSQDVQQQNFTSYALPYINLTNGDNDTATPAYMIAGAVSNPGLTISFQELNTLVAAVSIIRSPPEYSYSDWRNYSPLATECALYWCTKAYTARAENGIFNESVVGNWSERDPQSYTSYILNETELVDFDAWNNHSLVNSDAGTLRSDLQLRISDDQAREKALPVDASRVFNISQSSIESTSYAIRGQLFSSGKVIWPLPEYGGGSLYPVTSQAFGTTQTQDYDGIFENIAQRLTGFMRGYSNTTHIGEQQEWVIHIRVRWAYLVLPLLVVVGACLVLVLTIIETKHRKLEPWKSDVLSTFTHSVDAGILEQLRIAEAKGQASNTAKNTTVRLVDTGEFVELKAKRD
ncbi:hypothetical protein E8E14_010244 [Neopestalotiopsis sp. 37M]|nr:hypothetical protein E8E14_010244 [Neopestalotiopsis sp. 37M]